jgi:hypothetical protein
MALLAVLLSITDPTDRTLSVRSWMLSMLETVEMEHYVSPQLFSWES